MIIMSDLRGTSMDGDMTLAGLSRSDCDNWYRIGQLLLALEATSRVSPEGLPWLEVLSLRLNELGKPKTLGHLRKLRRASLFVNNQRSALSDVSAEDVGQASIVAVEAAERLFRLNSEKGLIALRDAIGGASPRQVQELYDAAKADHADQLTARHLGWKNRIPKTKAPAKLARDAIMQQMVGDVHMWWGLPEGSTLQQLDPGRLIPVLEMTDGAVFGVSASGARCLGGFLIIDLGRPEDPGWSQALARVLLVASFFDRFWVVLSGGQAFAKAFWRDIATLDPGNIGLAVLLEDGSGGVETIGAEWQIPQPDRRDRLLNMLLAKRLQ
jgi:hypothetical protein